MFTYIELLKIPKRLVRMTKITIGEIDSVSLNEQMQIEIKGGINMQLLNLLEQNKNDLVVFYGKIPSDIFMLNIVIDHGIDNEIYQSTY